MIVWFKGIIMAAFVWYSGGIALLFKGGAWMSKSAAGNYTFLCFVGALDLSISFALLTSSVVFWQLRTFSTSRN